MNSDESFSVWAIDLNKRRLSVISKIKNGVLGGKRLMEFRLWEAPVPNSIVASDSFNLCEQCQQ